MASTSSAVKPPVSMVTVTTSAPSSFWIQRAQKVVSRPPENARTITGFFFMLGGHPGGDVVGEALLGGGALDGDEHGVVARESADHAGKVDVVQGQGDARRRAGV